MFGDGLTPPSPKEEKMMRVAEYTLRLIHQHGLEGLTHSRLARAAGVSRPWIYAYVGKDKSALITLAVNYFGRLFARFDDPPASDTEVGWIRSQIEGLKTALDTAEKYPWLMPIYFRYRATESEIGQSIMNAEKFYVRRQTLELQNALKIDSKNARVVVELTTAFKLGLAYRWASTTLYKDISEAQVLLLAKNWIKGALKRG